MATAAIVFWVLNALNITVNIRNVCVLLAPWFASNTAIVTYFFAKEVKNSSTGLVAAAFIAIVPGTFSFSFFSLHYFLFSFFFFIVLPLKLPTLIYMKGYISRSVAGSFDNEGIAIFALILTYATWVKAVNSGSLFWSAICSLSYFYMVSAWGGYVFIINLIPLHVLTLLFTGRYR